MTFIFVFENSQNPFPCGPPLGPFWSVKYLNFEQKLPIRTIHHNFLESRHTEVTKYPHYILSPEWSQKKISSWTIGQYENFILMGEISVEPNDVSMKNFCQIYGCKNIVNDRKSFNRKYKDFSNEAFFFSSFIWDIQQHC